MTTPAVEIRAILDRHLRDNGHTTSLDRIVEDITSKYRLYRKDGPVKYKAKMCALATCKKRFTPIREWQDYHSISCRQKAYRRRVKNGI